MNLEKEIKLAFEEIGSYGDELAYLGLTTKIEIPFRDWLAVKLHKKSGKEYMIAREYPEVSATNNKTLRTDLAILKDGIVKERVELKACYTFDIPKKNRDYNLFWNQVLADYEKHKFIDGNTYFLLLAVHPIDKIEDSKNDVIKYYSGHRRFSKHYTQEELLKDVKDDIPTEWKTHENLKLKDSGFHEMGEAFGIRVGIVYYLWEKVN